MEARVRPDTPPPFPVVVETLKSREDIIAASRLADWSKAPAGLLLPQLIFTFRIPSFAWIRPPEVRGCIGGLGT